MCIRNNKAAETMEDDDRETTKAVIGLGLAHLIIQVSIYRPFAYQNHSASDFLPATVLSSEYGR